MKKLITFLLILLLPVVTYAADSKVTGLTADATPGTDSLLYTIDDPLGTPVSRKSTIEQVLATGNLPAAVILEADIDTFSEIDTIVADKSLTNKEDAATIIERWTFAGTEEGTDVVGLNVDWAQGNPVNGQVAGDLWYDSAAGAYKGYTSAEIQLGQASAPGQIAAIKATGGTIAAGDAVYLTGWDGTNLTIELADADDTSKMPAIGISKGTITDSTAGIVVTFGLMEDLINTGAMSVQDPLYVTATGTTGNTLTTTRPTGVTSQIQSVAKVVTVDASGEIFVAGALRTNDEENLGTDYVFIGDANQAPSQTKFDLDGLVDVGVSTSTAGNLLIANGAEEFNSRTVTGDITIDATAVTTIGVDKVQTDEIDLAIDASWTGTHTFSATLAVPTGADREVTVEGALAWDTDEDALRGYDGTNQIVVGETYRTLSFTISDPLDLTDASDFLIWRNKKLHDFVVTDIHSLSTADDTDFSLIEKGGTDLATEGTTLAHVTISTNGVGVYYNDLTGMSKTISIGNTIVFDNDATDAPGWIQVIIKGYFNGDVD